MANGATRLQPLVLNIGQAAGLSAALCVQQACRPAELPVTTLQRALIDDPQAPAAPFPLWDTAWHHPHWRARQLRCLHDPQSISPAGTLAPVDPGDAAGPGGPAAAPPEPHEQLFSGRFSGTLEQGYTLETSSRCWPLITLEPALHAHLATLNQGAMLQLIGCANPWGPWLRLSRLHT